MRKIEVKDKEKKNLLNVPKFERRQREGYFSLRNTLSLLLYFFNYHDKVTSTILNSQLWKTPKSHHFIH